jgi:hypothetical protein
VGGVPLLLAPAPVLADCAAAEISTDVSSTESSFENSCPGTQPVVNKASPASSPAKILVLLTIAIFHFSLNKFHAAFYLLLKIQAH